jgi:hypothetical protein
LAKGSLSTLSKRARTLLDQITAKVLRDEAGKVIAFARGRWPVDTGRSKAALRWVQDPDGKVHLLCQATQPGRPGVKYAPYIKSHGLRPWNDLIVVPAKDSARRAPHEIARRFLAAMRVR